MAENVEFDIIMKDLFSNTLGKLHNKIKGIQTETDKAQKSSSGFLSTFKGTMLGGLAANAVSGLANQVGGLATDIFKVTAEFEKHNAVLTSTFGGGSSGAEMAKASMGMIREFARTTPFEVNELNTAFVKLANRGIRPTSEEFTALGDLASSTGKSMDQLAEALLDAQMNEWERLKEFGIKGKVIKGTDKVTLSFKNLSKTVKNTPESIKNALIEFGKMEGVAGMMGNISKTMGGQASNLSDTFNNLKLQIGQLFSGSIGGGMKFLNDMIERVSYFISWIKENIGQLQEVFRPLTNIFSFIWNAWGEIAQKIGLAGENGLRLKDIFNTIGSILKFLEPLIMAILHVFKILANQIIDTFKWIFKNIFQPTAEFLNDLLPDKYQFKMMDFGFKEPKKEDTTTAISDYDKLLKQYEEMLKLQDKTLGGGGGGGGGGNKDLKSEVDKISSKQPSNVYINIDAIIKGDVNNMISNVKNPQSDMTTFLENLENALLTVIDDVNYVVK